MNNPSKLRYDDVAASPVLKHFIPPPSLDPMTQLDAKLQKAFAETVTRTLRDAGYEAYWAGGCVRDRLMGRVPKDYDIATSAKPDQIREVFGRPKTIAIGESFGVMTVIGDKETGNIEIATFRNDASYSDGRHPDSVTYSTAAEDAHRRDFTINGMFYDPLENHVIDFVGGQADLHQGIIRAIGLPQERIAEDKLRMLRAVRFAAIFGFKIDEATRAAISSLADQITVVSAERIAEEMRRMLKSDGRGRAMQLLHETGLLAAALPSSVTLPEAGAWQRVLCALVVLEKPTFEAALACVFYESLDASGARELGSHWRLANKEGDRFAWLLEHRTAWQGAATAYWPDLQRLLIHEGAEDLLTVAAARIEVGDGAADDVQFCRDRLALPAEELNPPPLVTGDDLIAAGIPAGRHFQRLLKSARDAQLLGKIDTQEAALKLASQEYDAG